MKKVYDRQIIELRDNNEQLQGLIKGLEEKNKNLDRQLEIAETNSR